MSTPRPITALVFMRRPAFFCLGVNALVRTKRDGKNVRLWSKDALFFCCWNSAADISKSHTSKWEPLADEVLEAAWSSPRRKNVVRQHAPFKCMGFWYISSRISAAEKKRASLVWIGPKGHFQCQKDSILASWSIWADISETVLVRTNVYVIIYNL